ncbi:MAG: condensation domain-containing protein [Patescibacteria group bacterium]|jgi:non-ribosomal peptide synthetase component F
MGKINSIKIEAAYPLSPVQKGILFQSIASPQAQLYVEQMAVKITGKLNIRAFKESWRLLVQNNPIFRTLFDYRNGNEPLQFVIDNLNVNFIYKDLSNLTSREFESCWLNYQTKDRSRGFELELRAPYRLAIFKINDSNFRFLFSYHHILLDGGSIPIIIHDIAYYYSEIVAGRTPKTIMNKTYKEYVIWLSGQNQKTAKKFWEEYCQNFRVNFNKKGTELKTTLSSSKSLTFDHNICDRLKVISRTNSLTLASILTGIWGIVYCSFCNRDETILGIPTSVQPLDKSGGDFIGVCINTIPLKVRLTNVSYLKVIRRVQEDWYKTNQYNHLPLGEIKKLFSGYDLNDPFDSIFAFSSHKQDNHIFKGVNWELLDHLESTPYPISTDLVWSDSSMLLKITYRPEFYSSEEIEILLEDFKKKLNNFLNNPEESVVIYKIKRQNLLPQSKKYDDSGVKLKYNPMILNTLIGVWKNLFPGNIIDTDSNFFELGGDSITSLRLVSKLLTLGIKITPQDIFEYQTPGKIASKIFSDRLKPGKKADIKTKNKKTIPKAVMDFTTSLYGSQLEKVLPVSNVQKGLLESGQKEDLFHDQSTFTYTGNLDHMIFESAWNNVIKRNSSLRAFFCKVERNWYQCTIKHSHIRLDYIDISQKSTKNKDTFIKKAIHDDRLKSFSVENGPLIRISLFKLDKKEFKFFLRFHVLIMDGWCFAFVLKEIMDEYDALMRKTEFHPVKRPSYEKYIEWLSTKDISEAKKYWTKYLSGTKSALSIPREVTKDNSLSYDVKMNLIDLPDQLLIRLGTLAAKHKVTLNTLFQTAWAINLCRFRQTKEVVIGITVSQRPAGLKGSEEIIGLFFNDIPLRFQFKNNYNFWKAAKAIQKDFQNSNDYQYLSAYEVKRELGLKQTEDLFQTLLVYENYPKQQEDALKSKQQNYFVNTGYWRREMSDIDLTVYIETRTSNGHIKGCYLDKLISDDTASSVLNGFLAELNKIK